MRHTVKVNYRDPQVVIHGGENYSVLTESEALELWHALDNALIEIARNKAR